MSTILLCVIKFSMSLVNFILLVAILMLDILLKVLATSYISLSPHIEFCSNKVF